MRNENLSHSNFFPIIFPIFSTVLFLILLLVTFVTLNNMITYLFPSTFYGVIPIWKMTLPFLCIPPWTLQSTFHQLYIIFHGQMFFDNYMLS